MRQWGSRKQTMAGCVSTRDGAGAERSRVAQSRVAGCSGGQMGRDVRRQNGEGSGQAGSNGVRPAGREMAERSGKV